MSPLPYPEGWKPMEQCDSNIYRHFPTKPSHRLGVCTCPKLGQSWHPNPLAKVDLYLYRQGHVIETINHSPFPRSFEVKLRQEERSLSSGDEMGHLKAWELPAAMCPAWWRKPVWENKAKIQTETEGRNTEDGAPCSVQIPSSSCPWWLSHFCLPPGYIISFPINSPVYLTQFKLFSCNQ